MVDHMGGDQGHALYVRLGRVSSMDHKGDVNILKAAIFDHGLFAAGCLLSRGSIYDEFVWAGGVAETFFQGAGGAQNPGTLHMVGTSVPQSF